MSELRLGPGSKILDSGGLSVVLVDEPARRSAAHDLTGWREARSRDQVRYEYRSTNVASILVIVPAETLPTAKQGVDPMQARALSSTKGPLAFGVACTAHALPFQPSARLSKPLVVRE